jgi:hypothetical protein
MWLIWGYQAIIAITTKTGFVLSILQGTLPYYLNWYSQEYWKEKEEDLASQLYGRENWDSERLSYLPTTK